SANAATPTSATTVIDATKLWRQRLRSARPRAGTALRTPRSLSIVSASGATIDRVRAAGSSLGRLAGATAGRLAATGALLATVAAIVVAGGGAGLFGSLGALVGGGGDRQVTEGGAGARGATGAAIVAAPARRGDD